MLLYKLAPLLLAGMYCLGGYCFSECPDPNSPPRSICSYTNPDTTDPTSPPQVVIAQIYPTLATSTPTPEFTSTATASIVSATATASLTPTATSTPTATPLAANLSIRSKPPLLTINGIKWPCASQGKKQWTCKPS